MSDNWGFETKQIHVGGEPDPTTGARAVPIYQTTSFEFQNSDHAANLFALAEVGNIYTRIMNPTQGALEARLNALEGGCITAIGLPGALAVASGQAASTLAVMNLAESGDHVVASPSLYGGSYNLLHYTLPKMGIEVTFVDDPDDLDQWRAASNERTKCFYGESIPNPKNDVLDIKGISDVAHDVGVPLIVDNTVATPYLIRPLEHGADIVVHSLTKFIGGHGTSIGGAIIDGGTFDYGDAERFPNFNDPDPSYHGLAYWPALGHGSFILKARVQLLRDVGMAISPFNAFLFLQGLETLSLRMERHWSNATEVGRVPRCARSGRVGQLLGPARRAPGTNARRNSAAARGYGSVLAFEIAGGHEAGKKFVEGLTLHSHVANIGDARSLVIHPALHDAQPAHRRGAGCERRHPRAGPAVGRSGVDR